MSVGSLAYSLVRVQKPNNQESSVTLSVCLSVFVSVCPSVCPSVARLKFKEF